MWFSRRRRPKQLSLALQGGGAHGAFTWGVLDHLLLDEEVEITGISATSAGAFNAIAVAHGLAQGDRHLARSTLRALWSEVEATRVPDLLRLNPLLSSFAKTASPVGVFSPYSFNPLGFDPLRRILETHIDFDAVRANAALDIRIAATDIATGRARLFKTPEISVETVLASACLPTLHHAVTIDGRSYWDGGFSANPDLLALATGGIAGDTLLVLLNPVENDEVPKTAAAIESRVNTITFNQPLLRDIDSIARARSVPGGWFASRDKARARLKAHRFHLIDAGRHTASLGAGTKITPDREVLSQLYHAGLGECERWLATHKQAVGKRATVDLAAYFAPRVEAFATDPAAEGDAAPHRAPLVRSA